MAEHDSYREFATQSELTSRVAFARSVGGTIGLVRHAVVRINPDPSGELGLESVLAVRNALLASGVRVIEADLTRSLPRRRELEVILADDDPDRVRQRALALVRRAMHEAGVGGEPAAGAVTFTSTGTPADALGIFRAFGVAGEVRRAAGEDDDSVVFVVHPDALEHVSESRLRTALQSGLNKDVTLVTEWSRPTDPLDQVIGAATTAPIREAESL